MTKRTILVVGAHTHDQVNTVVDKLTERGVTTHIISHEASDSTGYVCRDGIFEFDGVEFDPDVIWAADKYTIIPYGAHDAWALKRTKELEWRSINRNTFFLHAHKTRNPPMALYFEFRKLEQMATAQTCEFTVPSWTITDDRGELSAVLQSYGQAMVKPIGERSFPIFNNKGEQRSFTPGGKVLDTDTLAILTGQPLAAPIFIQKRIKRAYEIRSIVVGKDIFHFRAEYRDGKGPQERIMYQHPNCVIDQVERTDLEPGIRRFMAEFGLNYGHFDFIVDPDGRAFFLECNPNGVWMNFDKNGIISDAFARDLATQ